MSTVKILQTGDLHLETPFTGCRMSPAQARQRRAELRETFARIIGLVKKEAVQVLLLTGDLFEYQYATKDTVRFLSRQLAEIPAVRVFIAPGNHDPALPDSYYQTFPWGSHVHIFRRPGFERVVVPELGLAVHGSGWTQWECREPLLRTLAVPDRDWLNIILLHGDAAGPADSPYLPVAERELEQCGADYVALGHIHRYCSFSAAGKITGQYAGSPEPLNFGETGMHGVLLGEAGKGSSTWRFVPVAKRQYFDLALPVTEEMDTEAVLAASRSLVREHGTENLYKITLTGYRDPGVKMDAGRWREAMADSCFHAELINRTQPAYDLAEIAARQENTVLCQFVRRMQAEIAGREGIAREAAEKALFYGLDALTGQRGDRHAV